MFVGIERLRYDHDTQFIVKRFAFISMGSKMLLNMMTLYCPGVRLRPGLDHERVSVCPVACCVLGWVVPPNVLCCSSILTIYYLDYYDEGSIYRLWVSVVVSCV